MLTRRFSLTGNTVYAFRASIALIVGGVYGVDLLYAGLVLLGNTYLWARIKNQSSQNGFVWRSRSFGTGIAVCYVKASFAEWSGDDRRSKRLSTYDNLATVQLLH